MTKQYEKGKKEPGRKIVVVNARCPWCAKVRECYPSMVNSGNFSPANGRNDPLGRGINGIIMMWGNGEHDQVELLRRVS